jgi:type IV secretion system protein VirB8
MNMHSRQGLDAYYAEAASWNSDRVEAMRSSSRIAWSAACVAAAIALLEAIALVVLMPLKTVEPYTLLVDKTTGYVQALNPLDQAKISPDSALTQSFLAQYVIAREGFDIATLNANYRKVALFSADKARSGYLETMQASNPQSPLVSYPRTSVVDVRVKSISPIGPNTALVRYDTVQTDSGAQPGLPSPWVTIVRYRYSAAPMKIEDRFANPLGFQVVSYRKDAEAAPAAAIGVAGAAPIPATSYYPSAPAAPRQLGAAR